MPGLLGNGWEDPKSAAIMALAGGLLKGDFGGGLLGSQQAFSEAKQNAFKQQYLQAQMGELEAHRQERLVKAQREQEALELARRKQAALPGLYSGGGLTGGAPAPQIEGGIPMFSRPMGVTPMQSAPGGFNWQAALAAGYTPDEITKLAGLTDIGRPKATRQMEVDDGRGGKRIALVDDFGQEVAGFAGYTAPVQVNQGDRVSFVKPAPGVSLQVNQSPDSKASNALGWANYGLSKQRLALDANNAQAGKWQYDATRGGLVNMQTGEFKPATQNGQPIETKASREAAQAAVRHQGQIAQADSVLSEIRDAKKLVGWNTAGVGGVSQFVPATEGRDLSAKLQTVKANLGFDRLQQMREQSPTGGALGAVAVQELAALQATVASLDQMQSPAQLGKALDKIETHYTNWKNVVQQSVGGQGGATGGWDPKPKTKGGASVSNW